MRPIAAIGGGLAGAAVLSLIHESMKKIVPEAPRMDLLGMNVISKGLHAAGYKSPEHNQLFTWALAGDLAGNAVYYSLAGLGKDENAWIKSSLLGLAAGIGAVSLPQRLGLNDTHRSKSVATKLMTVGIYVAGALVTTAVMKFLEKKKNKKDNEWQERLLTSGMS